MDAFTTDATTASYSTLPPVLIAADGDEARVRALRSVEASGLRVAAVLAKLGRKQEAS